MTGWESILNDVARWPSSGMLEKKGITVGDEMDHSDLDKLKNQGAEGIKEHALSKHRTCGPDDPLAWYEPASSKHRIVYRLDKIVEFADDTLADILNHLNIERVSKDVVRCWRLAFISFIRRHEMFHYLFERGSRLLEEGREKYRRYREEVYEPRHRGKEKHRGNLEEALAEAYAAAWCRDELEQTFKMRREVAVLPLESLCRDLKIIFVNTRQAPGYREARYFLEEMEKLHSNRNLPIVHPIQTAVSIPKLLYDETVTSAMFSKLIYGEEWYMAFKGLAWLFHELHTGKPSPFDTNDRNKPPSPFSIGIFTAFLANIQNLRSIFEILLPLPGEEIKKRRRAF